MDGVNAQIAQALAQSPPAQQRSRWQDFAKALAMPAAGDDPEMSAMLQAHQAGWTPSAGDLAGYASNIPGLGLLGIGPDVEMYSDDPESRTPGNAALSLLALAGIGPKRLLGRVTDDTVGRMKSKVPAERAAEFDRAPRDVWTDYGLFNSLLKVRPKEAQRIWDRLPSLVENPEFVARNYQEAVTRRPLLASSVPGRPDRLDAVPMDLKGGEYFLPSAFYGPPRTIMGAEPKIQSMLRKKKP